MNAADRRSDGHPLCFNRVCVKSYFPQHSFHTGSKQEKSLFVAKVVSLYHSFERRCFFTNGSTSAVSCVTVASDPKPLNYYTRSRETKDVELFKVPQTASTFVCSVSRGGSFNYLFFNCVTEIIHSVTANAMERNGSNDLSFDLQRLSADGFPPGEHGFLQRFFGRSVLLSITSS